MSWRPFLCALLCLVFLPVQSQNITEQWHLYEGKNRQPVGPVQVTFDGTEDQPSYQSIVVSMNDYPLTEALFSPSPLGQLIFQVQQGLIEGELLGSRGPCINCPIGGYQPVFVSRCWQSCERQKSNPYRIFQISDKGQKYSRMLLIFTRDLRQLLRIVFSYGNLMLDFVHPVLEQSHTKKPDDKDEDPPGTGILAY